MKLQAALWQLFDQQMELWPLAAENYRALAEVQERTLTTDGYAVRVQFNPARMVSTGAKVDTKSIAARPCFLCEANRPAEQAGLTWGDYTLLVNPFPIFPHHFTIVRAHQPQELLPYVGDLLALAEELSELVLFYNGPRCGASAPDHLHFQAGDRTFMPLVEDYMRLRAIAPEDVPSDAVTHYGMPSNYDRAVVGLSGSDTGEIEKAFQAYYKEWQVEEGIEPMMNVVCWFEGEQWHLLILPRAAFRPHQYGFGAAPELLISPATVEMGGVVITPVKEHFERLCSAEVRDIYQQISKRD